MTDFYFKCPKLNAKLSGSACERNRTFKGDKTRPALSDMVCRECQSYEEYQVVQISAEDFLKGIKLKESDRRTVPYIDHPFYDRSRFKTI
jgi:hypothetical protein